MFKIINNTIHCSRGDSGTIPVAIPEIPPTRIEIISLKI